MAVMSPSGASSPDSTGVIEGSGMVGNTSVNVGVGCAVPASVVTVGDGEMVDGVADGGTLDDLDVAVGVTVLARVGAVVGCCAEGDGTGGGGSVGDAY
jgi:hypothetical protein